jgi:FkbM family methyltransferase
MNLTSQAASLLPDRTFCRLVALAHVRFEPELKPLVRACDPNGVSVDVGAWFGPWTYWLSRRVERVVAFEANPEVAKVLQAGARNNVVVHNVAVSDHIGVASLAVSGHGLGQEGRSSIDDGDVAVDAKHIAVTLTTLDDMDLTDVRFLKVDVEGYDLTVLRGAKSLLSTWHPVVVAELEQRYCDVAEAIAYMADLGYGAYVLLDGTWRSLDHFDLVADQQAKLISLANHGFLRTALYSSGNYINNVVFVHPESTWAPW